MSFASILRSLETDNNPRNGRKNQVILTPVFLAESLRHEACLITHQFSVFVGLALEHLLWTNYSETRGYFNEFPRTIVQVGIHLVVHSFSPLNCIQSGNHLFERSRLSAIKLHRIGFLAVSVCIPSESLITCFRIHCSSWAFEPSPSFQKINDDLILISPLFISSIL